MIKRKKTDPDHLNMTGQYVVNTASRFADIVRMIPYGS
jgi:hypothetical protein